MTPTTSSRANRDLQLQSSKASSLSDFQDHHNGSHAAAAASAADSSGAVTMDDLLKNIYSDNSPATADPSLFNHGGVSLPGGGGAGDGGDAGVGTTVDEVWKEIVAGSDRASGMLEEELTLEDFLMKNGAVREEDVRIGGGGGGGTVGVGVGDGVSDNNGGIVGRLMVGRGKNRAVEEPVDKATQQKQRRMIKNQELAARS
ncbi:hypothetical protein NL676_006468 [Syzygium grande]|nr:hypothetical protein NL676_006468 [Syzygium grande]